MVTRVLPTVAPHFSLHRAVDLYPPGPRCGVLVIRTRLWDQETLATSVGFEGVPRVTYTQKHEAMFC